MGLALEGSQYLIIPGRGTELSDILLDIVGAAAGSSLLFLLDALKINQSFLSVTASGMTFTLIVLGGTGAVVWDPSLPRVGDHWHAWYQISVCGRPLPPLSGTTGGVHTHGNGLIHIHPRGFSESGASATLALFFSTSGGELTNNSLTLPSGEAYTNGVPCPDGTSGYLGLAWPSILPGLTT